MCIPVVQYHVPSPERLYILAGAKEYDDREHFAELSEVPSELQQVRRTLDTLGFHAADTGIESDPETGVLDPRWLPDAIKEWARKRRPVSDGGPLPYLVVYCTAHGVRTEFNEWFLAGKTSWRGDSDTMVRSRDLMDPFVERKIVEQVLIILDACHSEHGALEGLEPAVRNWTTAISNVEGWYIAAARIAQRAEQSLFADAFATAVKRSGGHSEHIDIDQLTGGINSAIDSDEQTVVNFGTPTAGPCRILPSPAWVPETAPVWLESTPHHVWSAPARGVQTEREPGWFFAPRRPALVDLLGLFDPEEPNRSPRLLVGAPGSGKSALLGHLLLGGHRQLRPRLPVRMLKRRLPPAGSVHAAVRLRSGVTVESVAEELAEQLGRECGSPEELVGGIDADTGAVGVLIDDLHRCGDVPGLAERLLRPLAALSGIRLALSAPSREASGLDEGDALVIDLDAALHLDGAVLRSYLEERLSRTPGCPAPGRLVSAVSRIADRAADNFGAASAGAAELLRSGDLDQALDKTGRQLLQNLKDAIKDTGYKPTDVLNPLLVAPDEWLPESLWSRLATGLTGRAYTVEDIQRAAQVGRFALDRREGPDEPEWRLRGHHRPLVMPVANVREALLRLVPVNGGRRVWQEAPRGTARRILAWSVHSAADLLQLLTDADFLIAVPPTEAPRDLSRLVGEHEEVRRAVDGWRRLHRPELTGTDREVLISMLDLWPQGTAAPAPPEGTPLRIDWTVLFRGRQSVDGVVDATGLATAEDGPRVWAVTSHDDGSVRAWSVPGDGAPVQIDTFGPTPWHIRDLAVTTVDGAPLVVIGHWSGRIVRWRPQSGDVAEIRAAGPPVGERLTLLDRTLTVLYPDRCPVVVDALDGTIELGRPEGSSAHLPDYRLRHSRSGRTVALVDAHGNVGVYALLGRRRLFKVSVRPPMSIAVADDALVTATSTPEPRLRLYELTTGCERLSVPIPAPPVGVEFTDDGRLIVAWTEGIAGLRLL